jgi:hypothetical protein
MHAVTKWAPEAVWCMKSARLILCARIALAVHASEESDSVYAARRKPRTNDAISAAGTGREKR